MVSKSTKAFTCTYIVRTCTKTKSETKLILHCLWCGRDTKLGNSVVNEKYQPAILDEIYFSFFTIKTQKRKEKRIVGLPVNLGPGRVYGMCDVNHVVTSCSRLKLERFFHRVSEARPKESPTLIWNWSVPLGWHGLRDTWVNVNACRYIKLLCS